MLLMTYLKICVPNETKDVNVKACSMKTRISEYDCKCKFFNATCNLIEKRIMINVNVSVKSFVQTKKIIF